MMSQVFHHLNHESTKFLGLLFNDSVWVVNKLLSTLYSLQYTCLFKFSLYLTLVVLMILLAGLPQCGGQL